MSEAEQPGKSDHKVIDPAHTLPASDPSGHRSRLRGRLIDGGPEALLDHELVEYLLALAIPRRDTKPLAKRLLHEFGGLSGLMAASPRALTRISGMGDTSVAAIKIVQATALRMLRSQVSEQPVLSNWQALLDYLHADMAALPIERVRVLHLNSRNILIRDEHMGDGSIDEAAIYVREVLKRAVELGSASLILVHNHPGGSPEPSRADIDVTRRLIAAMKPLGIAVHDHVIISRSGHSSMRATGLI